LELRKEIVIQILLYIKGKIKNSRTGQDEGKTTGIIVGRTEEEGG
jgi:hypothetical protein